MSGRDFDTRMRLGEAGWQTGRRYVDLPAYSDFSPADRKGYEAFLLQLLNKAKALLNESGSIFLHTDQGGSAYARLLMDQVFGAENFRNEIIWRYQTGGRSKRYFSRKHDTILFYAKSPSHFFDITQVPSQKKAERSSHMKRLVDEKGRATAASPPAAKPISITMMSRCTRMMCGRMSAPCSKRTPNAPATRGKSPRPCLTG